MCKPIANYVPARMSVKPLSSFREIIQISNIEDFHMQRGKYSGFLEKFTARA